MRDVFCISQIWQNWFTSLLKPSQWKWPLKRSTVLLILKGPPVGGKWSSLITVSASEFGTTNSSWTQSRPVASLLKGFQCMLPSRKWIMEKITSHSSCFWKPAKHLQIHTIQCNYPLKETLVAVKYQQLLFLFTKIMITLADYWLIKTYFHVVPRKLPCYIT